MSVLDAKLYMYSGEYINDRIDELYSEQIFTTIIGKVTEKPPTRANRPPTPGI